MFVFFKESLNNVATVVWGLNPGHIQQFTGTEAGTLSGLLSYGTYVL